ncbi:hypothetical protein COV11_00765 [Candidatus Woesearchaeota archaeon CG10_big_fil_rev_8_21_14_0_10_30_7]|nr:MAG: hypothetical protein COV11_00765 [Candidatus Woesearchaeota archaeon CG10_big_fil_rev_8_21_14_0_10_30_7]
MKNKKLLRQTKLVHSFRGVLFVFSLAFILNFVWESYHAFSLYKGHDLVASEYLRIMTYVSTVDGLLISAIFLSGCFLWRKDICWIKNYDFSKALYTIILGFIIASIIEIKALIFGHWEYSELMPTLFGMGLSPLVQLSITGAITFYVASKFFYGNN